MKKMKPLALTLSLLFVIVPMAKATADASLLTFGKDADSAAGLEMMQLNASLLRNGDNVWERLRDGFQMPEVSSERVQRQIRYYANRPDLFKRSLSRSHKYLFYILNQVERRGMPTEIALLPMVESSFVPSATSPVGAAGLWQFMPGTGKQYGLEQTWWYDGRRDVTAATNAALDYLQTLYTQFGDWSLALSAYNWGEGNLARSIARTRAAGLPVTFENIRMPAETRNYVPKLLAIRDLLADPTTYGLHLEKFPNKPYFVAVTPSRHMDISVAAKLAGISVKEFVELNPAFNLPVYAYKAGREMLLPTKNVQRFEANLANWDKPLLTWQVYTPTTAESAGDLASRFGMHANQFLSVNHMTNSTVTPGRPVLVAMNNPAKDSFGSTSTLPDTSFALADNNVPSSSKPLPSITIIPSAVASAAPPDLAATNKPSPTISVAAAEPPQAAPAVTSTVARTEPQHASPATQSQPQDFTAVIMQASNQLQAAEPVATSTQIAMAEPVLQMAQASSTQYTVAAGDTLHNISRRYNLTVAELRSFNGLSNNNVKVGQVLQLGPQASAAPSPVIATVEPKAKSAGSAIPTEYVVKHGDTLYSIAHHFGVDGQALMKLNKVQPSTKLKPGQVVKIQAL